jgi:hypothetical protein
MGSVQLRTTGSASKADKGKPGTAAVRSVIAQYLELDVTRVTDTAHLSHDLEIADVGAVVSSGCDSR